MISILKLPILLLLIFILVLNCEGDIPLSEEEKSELNKARLYLTMDADFNLKVNVKNFNNVTSLKFIIIANDSNKFEIESYQLGDYAKLWTNLDESDIAHNTAEFLFGPVNGDGMLCNLTISEPNSYENISFHIQNVSILNGTEFLYYSCSDADYSSPSQCTSSGYAWSPIDDEYASSNLCFIKFYPGSTDPLFGDEFEWSDAYCWPWQN